MAVIPDDSAERTVVQYSVSLGGTKVESEWDNNNYLQMVGYLKAANRIESQIRCGVV